MTKVFSKFKNPFVGPKILAHLAKVFLKNPVLSHTSLYGFLIPCQNLDKTTDPIPRKRLDKRTEGQTLFYRTFWGTAGGLGGRGGGSNKKLVFLWSFYMHID